METKSIRLELPLSLALQLKSICAMKNQTYTQFLVDLLEKTFASTVVQGGQQ